MWNSFIWFRLTQAVLSSAHAGGRNGEIIEMLSSSPSFLLAFLADSIACLENSMILWSSCLLAQWLLPPFSCALLCIFPHPAGECVTGLSCACYFFHVGGRNMFLFVAFSVIATIFLFAVRTIVATLFLVVFVAGRACFLWCFDSVSSNKDSRRSQKFAKSLIVPSWGLNLCRCMEICHLRGTQNSRRSRSSSVGNLVVFLPGLVGKAVR